MSHNTDPVPSTPPDPHNHPNPNPNPPPDDEIFDLDDLEVVEAEPVEVEPAEVVSFEPPPLPADENGAHTIGRSLEDLAAEHGLPELLSNRPPDTAEHAPVAEAELPGNLEPVVPVMPASGWLDPADPADLPAPVVLPIEGSDIFAGGHVPEAEAVGSEIFATTPRPSNRVPPSRPSDVALTFDQPPGGSTVTDAGADADLPFAEEIPEASGNLFDAAPVEQADGHFSDHETHLEAEAIDTGASPFGPDASSILTDLSEDEGSDADSSALRLEDPGLERTLTDELPAPSADLRAGRPTGSGTFPTAELPGASDLFYRTGKSAPDFTLPDSAEHHPLDAKKKDHPSFASSPSSIFTGQKPAAGSGSGTGGSANVPVGNPDLSASGEVEFTAFPSDAASADKGGGAVDFDLPDRPPHPERTIPMSAQDSASIDWAGESDEQDILPAAGSGGMSGVLARGRGPVGSHPDMNDVTDQMSLPGRADAGKPPPVRKPTPAPKPDSSVELDWVADSDLDVPTAEAAVPAPPKKKKAVALYEGEVEEKIKPSGKKAVAVRGGKGGWVGGGLIGLLVGAGAFAGLYFGGVLPNEKPAAAGGADAATVAQLRKQAGDAEVALTAAKADASNLKMIAETAAKERDELAGAELAAKTKAADADKAAKKAVAAAAAAEKKATAAAEAAKQAADKQAAAEKAAKDATATATDAQEKEKEAKLAAEKADEAKVAAEKAKADADAARKAADAALATVAKDLQAAKLLGEKYDAAALLAAAKEAATRASGPDIRALLPAGAAAVAGTGLSGGQLVDLATRLGKAESAVKAADAKLTAEKAKLTAGYDAEMKKLTAAAAADLAKQKEQTAAESKKQLDKFAADMKKANDDHAAKVKALEDAVAAEKAQAAAMAKKFETDLGNAVSPSAALDLWLTILTGQRREADAGPALKAAAKVLASAPAGSEEAAKARTVAGVAHLILGQSDAAAEELKAARESAAHRAAAGKPWAAAADTWMAAVDDPSAPVRRPAPEGTDPTKAPAQLDAGMRAYRTGDYTAAEAVLVKAVDNAPENAVAWYYLGAARWQLGKEKQAREDFKQGGVRERARTRSVADITGDLRFIQGPARTALDAARP